MSTICHRAEGANFLRYMTIILEYTPRGGGAPFEKLELAFRNELTQTFIFIDVGIVVSSLHIVFFDVDYVKFSLRCQNIFSAARHLQFGNLRVPQRPGNANPVKGCYVALFRTLDSANNATQSAFKCVEK